jgi:hypothetical protein
VLGSLRVGSRPHSHPCRKVSTFVRGFVCGITEKPKSHQCSAAKTDYENQPILPHGVNVAEPVFERNPRTNLCMVFDFAAYSC